ncbi:hypothetical protein ABZ345_22535 [Lentzea sp. NPDC005914]|uniref:hypothetical protein n=1 Tax=Lentzea sp. NPDC005914 TaxID=3154572 RepID=UPI0033C3AAFC
MRAFLLYARSRQVPASVAAAALCCLLVRLLPDDPRFPALAITAAVSALAVGLTGQDADLDRTAARPWPAYRLAHVLAIATVTALLVAGMAPVEFVVRGCVGMTGLAALAAALFGGHMAWTLPCAWFAISVFTESWLVAPTGSLPAMWFAIGFGAAGAAVQVFFQSTLKL